MLSLEKPKFSDVILQIEKAIFGKVGYDQSVQTALQLWEDYEHDAIELIKRITLEGRKSEDPNKIKETTKERLRRKENRRLLRNKDLQQLAEDAGIKPVYEYRWDRVNSFWSDAESNPQIQKWLSSQDAIVNKNPFQPWIGNEFDISTWVPPDEWEEITSPMFTLVYSDHPKDLKATAYTLEAWLQGQINSNRSTFSIVLDEMLAENISPEQFLLALTQSAAEKWIHFLPDNPDAFLDLSREQSLQLSALLLWHTGSSSILASRLDRSENAALNKERQRMVLRLQSTNSLSTEGKILPPLELMLDWLSITPPGYKGTCAILLLNQPEFIDHVIEIVDLISTRLLRKGIIAKIFSQTPALPKLEKVDSFSSVHLSWDDERLRAFSKSRIQKSNTTGKENFNDLFDRIDKDVEKLLIHKSQHSMNRFLFLGNQVILEHIKRDPNEAYLGSDDLKIL